MPAEFGGVPIPPTQTVVDGGRGLSFSRCGWPVVEICSGRRLWSACQAGSPLAPEPISRNDDRLSPHARAVVAGPLACHPATPGCPRLPGCPLDRGAESRLLSQVSLNPLREICSGSFRRFVPGRHPYLSASSSVSLSRQLQRDWRRGSWLASGSKLSKLMSYHDRGTPFQEICS